ncbi:hypothetical protein IFM89_002901, partial [Coptis chinensis]
CGTKNACGDLSALELGKRIHEYAVRNGLAYGMNGQGRDAVALFSDMLESGVVPDQIVFVSILSACSHSGRAGLVDEAYKFISQMTVKPSEQLWGALLSACQVYSNKSLGLVAADHLFQLVPEQAGYYVLLSNIYAKAGRWNEVTAVRSVMKSRGISKMPGCSNVEMGKRVHTFLVGDQSHPQTKEIYEELDGLVSKMKEAGYVPALHDVEEEDKFCFRISECVFVSTLDLLSMKTPSTIRRAPTNHWKERIWNQNAKGNRLTGVLFDTAQEKTF